MTERELTSSTRKLNRRELLRDTGLVGGLLLFTGGLTTATVALGEYLDRQSDKDYYKGLPLTEYAEGTFLVDLGKIYLAVDPFNDPQTRYDAGNVNRVNGQTGSDKFYLENPGVVRAKDPQALTDGSLWMVLNSEISVPTNDPWWKDFFQSKDTYPQVLYLHGDALLRPEDPAEAVKLVRLTTNPDGTHSNAVTGKVVKPLGKVGELPYPVMPVGF